jgi:anti-sigma factor (TIGR02949 family)
VIKAWIRTLLGRTHGDLTCHEVVEILQQYLDGHLDDDRAARIESHLEECRRCGLEAETYERIKATVASQRAEIPPESIERLRAFGEQLARSGEPPTR